MTTSGSVLGLFVMAELFLGIELGEIRARGREPRTAPAAGVA